MGKKSALRATRLKKREFLNSSKREEGALIWQLPFLLMGKIKH